MRLRGLRIRATDLWGPVHVAQASRFGIPLFKLFKTVGLFCLCLVNKKTLNRVKYNINKGTQVEIYAA